MVNKKKFFWFPAESKNHQSVDTLRRFQFFYKIENILKYKLHNIVFSKDSFDKNPNRFQNGALLCHQSDQKVYKNTKNHLKNPYISPNVLIQSGKVT